ncbi:hypothetical protein PAALTS15_25124 [Paenibacillus alvei TS-15]|uniref:Restriction endonuclease type II EcoRII C-terminal domain-containing protein n=1 Tax=Paenibacillus alvei TS-15 TaxID=1117108 RepID=S9SET9_PAEAL|nr:hypothetical protein [Paenibacillus alvei]EPY04402.1 hypothetical protein PAALTS15_25124 [Paenibacillus alvei TS-15]
MTNVLFKTKNDITSWEKAYWYLRLLINTDRYGGFHQNTNKLRKTADFILDAYNTSKSELDNDVRVEILLSLLNQLIMEGLRGGTGKYYQSVDLFEELKKYLLTPKDFYVFGVVIRDILLPTNLAIQAVPTVEGFSFAKAYATSLLDVKKAKALSTLIREWDLLTEDMCLNREREIIIDLFNGVKEKFQNDVDPTELDVLLTATCQEFERRTSQKRKQRAGKDLESATSFILDYFGIKGADGPEHFTAGMEVDNWVKDKRGWYIGISLKRTLRERWKQTYTTEIGLLDRFKIKYVIHLINNDRDLSDSKISEMGSYRHLFFVADDSKVLEELQDHVAIGQYLFPMSSLITKLKELTTT